MKKLKTKQNRLSTKTSDIKSRRLIVVVSLVALIGTATLLFVKAATPYASIELENGVISNGATSINDSSASGGGAVKFGSVTQPPPSGLRPISDTIYGVTVESVAQLSSLVSSLDRHTNMPTTRIVFQGGTGVGDYTTAINQMYPSSYIMGEILDSTALKGMSVDSYRTRTRDFVSAYSNKVDIWEIGNELNGDWVGTPSDINAKAQAAYDVVEKEYASSNLRSAITLNYWPSSDCYSYNWEDTATFANAMPTEVKNGVDYVLLSFYETACAPRAYPTNQQFIDIFNKLKTTFPNAKVGMGEIGAQGRADGLPSDPTLSEKQRIATRYYGMHNALKTALGPRYVGGYFWWYYFQDAVPYDIANSMWPTIEQSFNGY